MTTRSDPSFLIALALALTVHLALLAVGQQMARRNLGWMQTSRRPAPTPLPAITPPDPREQIGDVKALGQSINTTPGDRPMESAVSDAEQEQAMMSHEATGFPSSSARQSAASALQNQKAEAAQANVFAAAESAEADAAGPKSTKKSDDPKDTPATQPAENQTKEQANAQAQQQQQSQQDQQNASAAANGKPLPSSDYESYPVVTVATRYVNGRIEARAGRKVKTTRLPQIDPAAFADLIAMDPPPTVVLRLKIDESGNVADVQVEQSSGSRNVDLPCMRAAATWWMEPFVDPKTGKPHPQLVDFALEFR